MLKKTLQIFGVVLLGIGFSLIFFIIVLRWVNPPFTAFTLQAGWSELDQEFYSLRTNWVPVEELPEHMIWAVVSAEDQLFFEHSGFDVESIEEAWEERQKGVRTRGASTISQQVAKNLFLSPAQSFFRKGIEAGITVLIELFWTKERIIEVYLNIAEFGPGIYGIGKATEVNFNRPASQLTPEMSARFAAVLPSPKRMRVNPPSPYTRERSQWILRQMNQLTGKVYYAIDKDTTATKHTETDADTTAQDSTNQINTPDSATFDLSPDTLFNNLPDTTTSVRDTSNTSRVD